jgi:hypothetical protein
MVTASTLIISGIAFVIVSPVGTPVGTYELF